MSAASHRKKWQQGACIEHPISTSPHILRQCNLGYVKGEQFTTETELQPRHDINMSSNKG